LGDKPNCEASIKLLFGVSGEQQPGRADDASQHDGGHQDKIGADFVIAKKTHRHGERVKIEVHGVGQRHGHQPAHPHCVSTYFCEIIEEKCTEKRNGGAEHHDDQRLGNQGVAPEIDEHPEVENAREYVRPNALKAVFQLHGLHHVQRFHHKNGKNGHRKSSQEDHEHQLPLPQNIVNTKLVGIHQQQQQQHVCQHEQWMEKDGDNMSCCAEHG
jgi:hypothetical protein